MILGMIVRADRRGLRYQTEEAWRHLNPDVTVAIDTSPIDAVKHGFQEFDVYPDAIVTGWAGYTAPVSDEALGALLECDVVYTAETVYDPRITEKHPCVIRHVNCELYSPEGEAEAWFPSSWRQPWCPQGPTVPVPVPDERIASEPAGEGLLLHVAGWPAARDRNGTNIVRDVISRSHRKWRVAGQQRIRMDHNMAEKSERWEEVDDRWTIYDGCEALVMPRRYGGLSLPVQEAAARGLGLIMPDVSPNQDWPILALPLTRRRVKTFGGKPLEMVDVSALHLAELTDRLSGDQLVELQQSALGWARDHSWSKLAPLYWERFEKAWKETR